MGKKTECRSDRVMKRGGLACNIAQTTSSKFEVLFLKNEQFENFPFKFSSPRRGRRRGGSLGITK